jgi:uncharacterized protein (TIGR02246 family)
MSASSMQPQDTPSIDQDAIRALYQRVLNAWNVRDAEGFAAHFNEDGISIGFDGSTIEGQQEISAQLRGIFNDHPTGRYVARVREVRTLADGVAMLRAVAGMVPAAQTRIAPQLNALQTLIAVRHDGMWRIALFHNTPAQFHGRLELAQQLSDELQALVQ